jgi:hypothetical protein
VPVGKRRKVGTIVGEGGKIISCAINGFTIAALLRCLKSVDVGTAEPLKFAHLNFNMAGGSYVSNTIINSIPPFLNRTN